MKLKIYVLGFSIILSLFLISAFSVTSQNDEYETQVLFTDQDYIIIAGTTQDTKISVSQDASYIIAVMSCDQCTVTFRISDDTQYHAIKDDGADIISNSDIYLGDQASINAEYLLGDSGDWWVVLDNSESTEDVTVTVSLSIKKPITAQSTSVQSTNLEFISIVLVFITLGIWQLVKKKR